MKAQQVSVTLYPEQIKAVMAVAERMREGNFSAALRLIIDEHTEYPARLMEELQGDADES